MIRHLTTIAAAALALLAIPLPAHAFYTECTVRKTVDAVNRPGGSADPRWLPLERGAKVAIRDTYQDWIFVTYVGEAHYEYRWLPRSAVDHCASQEGTP
jgi:hypothetical protein